MGSNKSKIAFEICIVSGDFKEVEDQPSIFMVLFDEQQHQSPTLSYTDLIQTENGKIEAKFSIENKPWCKIKVVAFFSLHTLYKICLYCRISIN